MAITLTYTFSPNSTALSAEVNANFSLLATRATDKTGDTLTGALFTQLLEPDVTNTRDLGTTSLFYRTIHARTSVILGQSTANYTLTWANPASARAISFEDPGGTDILVYKAATQTLTNKTITAAVLSGSFTGTYTLAGTPTITAPTISGPTLSGTVIGTYTLGGTPTIPASGLTGTITSATQDLITRLGTIVVNTGVSKATPTFSWRDTGTALPGGLWRIASASDTLLVQRNTAVGGDFSSATNSLVFDNADKATFSGALAVTGAVVHSSTTQMTGAVSIGGANITDAVTTPTIASGFATSPSIVGKTFAFRVAVGGTGTSNTGTVNFGTTFTNIPIVVISDFFGDDVTIDSISTTQVTIARKSGANFTNSNQIWFIVRGY